MENEVTSIPHRTMPISAYDPEAMKEEADMASGINPRGIGNFFSF